MSQNEVPTEISELKRLFLPSTSEEKTRASEIWSKCSFQEKFDANHRLLVAFYRAKGVDLDAPRPKTTQRMTLGEEGEKKEQWHREMDQFLAER